ncbi:Bgt-506 [Blumeria graminis f. sp. tritici]|uniref:Bgt-506 n=2 Tax=Blumeria graminis f. sp. tritici TaxID=62690 RepID=A0A381L2Y9_BLUGR|nr:Pho85p cyclin of the Pho80p subfamily [Blumeria graminis f. sp. tritici 96224]VDB92507.1 Bgt-506 [Blumeria graminis f. sp. tritici]
MAAVISDIPIDSSRFYPKHTMLASSAQQRSPPKTQYLQLVNSLDVPSSPLPKPTSLSEDTPPPSASRILVCSAKDSDHDEDAKEFVTIQPDIQSLSTRPSFRFMSQENYGVSASYVGRVAQYYMQNTRLKNASSPSLGSTRNIILARPPGSSDDFKRYIGNIVNVRDLEHIQEFAFESFSSRRRTVGQPNTTRYEISSMPITDIIEMVACLLSRIMASNDRQRRRMNDHTIRSSGNSKSVYEPSSSVLSFHGKNVPGITIFNYLSRIHKYCPTTYEVFLSLLVYFDRMTERVNIAPAYVSERDEATSENSLIDLEESTLMDNNATASQHGIDSKPDSETRPCTSKSSTRRNVEDSVQSRHFVVDSFNIHRLVIAGVTCASKFFSDVFYTNSRYAKVGGLSLAELNHLELQFLLLNDFRLSVSIEELEIYGTMLVEFYGREVIASRSSTSRNLVTSPKTPS